MTDLRADERSFFDAAEAAYLKASETSEPADWHNAGLLAKQHRNALRRLAEAGTQGAVDLDKAALTEAGKALCKHSALFVDGFDGARTYSESARAGWRNEAIAAAECVVSAYLRAALPAPSVAVPPLPKRPVAFRVRKHRLSDQYDIFTDERDAQVRADARGIDYDGLYLVGDRASALITAPQDGVTEALTDCRNALVALRTRLKTEPSVQGRGWISLGNVVHNAIDKADAALRGNQSDGGKCFWPQCSDKKRCSEHGSCVALAQRKAIAAGDFPSRPSDTTPSLPEVSVEAMIDMLTDGEGDTVAFCSKNADFNGLPNECVVVNASWTNWHERAFRADTRLECLCLAVAAMKDWVAKYHMEGRECWPIHP